jgi:hypothetical protein
VINQETKEKILEAARIALSITNVLHRSLYRLLRAFLSALAAGKLVIR